MKLEFENWEKVWASGNWIKYIKNVSYKSDNNAIILIQYHKGFGEPTWDILFCGVAYELGQSCKKIFNVKNYNTITDVEEVKLNVDRMLAYMENYYK